MVIPVGGMGVPMPSGPPPAELAPVFSKIKVCVMTMVFSMLGKLVAGAIYQGIADALLDSLNLILNTVVGIFLMRDDPQIGKIYEFLARTCCYWCVENCNGGMSCLMTFIACNAITIILDIILNNALGTLINGFKLMFSGASMGIGVVHEFAFALWVISFAAAFFAQTAAVFFGWQAYSQARDSGISAQPGSWGGGGGGPTGAAWRTGGGGYPAAAEPARESRPAAGFQPFTGGGQRLGS